MKIRPKHTMTATALTLAALLVLSSATQVAGVVVCVGLDGHIDIESIFEGCCVSGPAGARGDAAELSASDSACGDCTDVQLKAPPLRSKETLQFQPDGDAGCSLCSLCSSTGVATHTVAVTGMDQHWQSLAPLTTVVLLT